MARLFFNHSQNKIEFKLIARQSVRLFQYVYFKDKNSLQLRSRAYTT